MDVAQLVEPRVVIPVVVGSSPIVHPIVYRLKLPAAISADITLLAAGKRRDFCLLRLRIR